MMISATVKFSESQKAQQGKKKRSLLLYLSISHKQKQILVSL